MQDKLDITQRERTNLLKWTAQFSPQFIEYLLETYAKPGDIVLDPFLGSGTVLHECGLAGLEAYGSELNPAAVILSRLYTVINNNSRRKELLLYVGEFVDDLLLAKQNEELPYEVLAQKLHEHLDKLSADDRVVFDCFVILLDIKRDENLKVEKLLRIWKRLQRIVENLPYSERRLGIFHADARQLPLPTNSVDLVITSPPYINVLNYHQQYRHSTELLGWDVLDIAKAEIGANRKNRSNRFLTVVSYAQEIAQCLEELKRVVKPNGRIIFVIGRQSKVRGIPFENGELVKKLASDCLGLDVIEQHERKFKNRYGQLIFEDILHFKNTEGVKKSELNDILSDIMKEKLTLAREESQADDVLLNIEDVIAKLGELRPSALFSRGTK